MNILKNQIEERKNLLFYFFSQKIEAITNGLPTDAFDKLINITTDQLRFLVSKDVISIDLEKMVKSLGLLPISKVSTESKILVIDINYLPSEIKDKPLECIREFLEQRYSCKALLLDGSRQNTQSSSQVLPAYFI